MRLPDFVDDMEVYADAVASLVSDLDSYVLVGDSFGGTIAIAFATRRPRGLQGLVVSGGFVKNPFSPVTTGALRLMGKARGGLYRNLVLPIYVRQLASPYDAEGQVPWSAAHTHRLFLENTPARSFATRLVAVTRADYTGRLNRIEVPTLILTPSQEGVVSEEAAKIMREGIPNAREIVLDRTGHMFRFSHPETYAREVKDFLAHNIDRTGERDTV